MPIVKAYFAKNGVDRCVMESDQVTSYKIPQVVRMKKHQTKEAIPRASGEESIYRKKNLLRQAAEKQ